MRSSFANIIIYSWSRSVSVVFVEVSETGVVVVLESVNIDLVVSESMVLVFISESIVIVAVSVIIVTALLMVKEVLSEMVSSNEFTTLTLTVALPSLFAVAKHYHLY
mgnify:CR=1 FL=1